MVRMVKKYRVIKTYNNNNLTSFVCDLIDNDRNGYNQLTIAFMSYKLYNEPSEGTADCIFRNFPTKEEFLKFLEDNDL